jgi:acyl phosphate:glycerol-3-phosphate acyltransferase
MNNNEIKIAVSFIILAYTIGSISSAILLCKFFNLPDPRSYGSNNPGTTNIMRLAGKKLAALVLLIDACKGFILVYCAKYLSLSNTAISLVALAAFLGQLFPIFFRFKGGKGIAITLGIILALCWQLALFCLFIWVIVFIKCRISSLAGITASILTVISSLFVIFTNCFINYSIFPIEFAVIILFLGLLILLKHKNNIVNLLNKTETKV